MQATYRDLWIRIGGSVLAAHYIDSLGRPESFFQQLTQWHYYIDLFFGSVIAFLLWTLTRTIVVWLDRRWPWFEKTALRLALQACLGWLAPVVFCFLLTFVFMRLVWQQDIFRSEYLYYELPVVTLVILLINVGYFTWWLYQYAQAATVPAQLAPVVAPAPPPKLSVLEKKSGLIEVPKAGKVVLLPAGELAYAYLRDGYCYLRTHSGESHVTTYALDDLFQLLDDHLFFRANRQMIINRQACRSYTSVDYGKISVELEPAYREPVVISQKRAKAFREWISVPA